MADAADKVAPGDYGWLVPAADARGSKAELVYGLLKQAIISGDLLPGAGINKPEVCDRLGISLVPVTTAINRLAFDRLVVIEPQKGSYVAPIRMDDVRQWMMARCALETEVAMEAARRLPIAAVNLLRHNLDYQRTAMEAGDHDGFYRLDGAFHDLLIEPLGLRRLEEMLAPLRSHGDRVRRLTAPGPGHNASTLAEHRAIFEAVERRAPDDAARTMRAHLDTVLDRVLALADQHPAFFGG